MSAAAGGGVDGLHKYLSGLLRHGWEESWLPELTLEQVAAIAALSNRALLEMTAALSNIEGGRHG